MSNLMFIRFVLLCCHISLIKYQAYKPVLLFVFIKNWILTLCKARGKIISLSLPLCEWMRRRDGWLFTQNGEDPGHTGGGWKTQKMILFVVMDCLEPSTEHLCHWCNWNTAKENNWHHTGGESVSPLKQYLDNKWPVNPLSQVSRRQISI